MAAFKSAAVNRLFFQNHFGDRVVLVGNGVNQFRERGFGALLVFRRNVRDFVIQTFVGFGRVPNTLPSG